MYLIDPTKITNFNCSDAELELHILFWVVAAGKNGVTSARCLNNLLQSGIGRTPFEIIHNFKDLPTALKLYGIGCYNNKAITMQQLANSGLDLRTCSVDDLEKIKGIGSKSSRCFIIHTRPNQELAGLDVHILRYLRSLGYDVPKSTPSGKKYKEIEKIFLSLVRESGMSVSEFDLKIWNKGRK